MIGIDDLIIGFVLSKLFGSANAGPAKSPAVVFQPPAGPTPPHPTGFTPEPQQPAAPAQLPAFPSQVQVPTGPTDAPAGFKRAIEVWQVNPGIAQQAGPALSGLG